MRDPHIFKTRPAPLLWCAALLLASAAHAQSAGEVEFSRGVGFAQAPGQTPRTLGEGLPLNEADRRAQSPRPHAAHVSAKVLQAEGELHAVDSAGQRRPLLGGDGVYPGDVVETGKATHAVLVFRDGSRITLGPVTRFRVDNFVYDGAHAGEGRFLVSILRGSMRALTGLIAKANPRNVGFTTSTAIIGIRGTGFDLDCSGSCAGESDSGTGGLALWAWLGSIEAMPTGQAGRHVIEAGQGLFITPAGVQPLSADPGAKGPRPDGVNVPRKLFSHDDVSTAPPQSIPRFPDCDRLPSRTAAHLIGGSGIDAGRAMTRSMSAFRCVSEDAAHRLA